MEFGIRYRILLLLSFFCANVNAQNSTKLWYFGDKVGLNFNQSPPQQLTNATVSFVEGCASIADANGNLLFYTNGISVINKNHQLMLNGAGIMGDPSSTNNTVIAPLPGSDNKFYLFTIGAQGQFEKGFRYSVIDMNLQNGLGEVVQKNVLVFDNSFEKMAAVRHCNKKDIWITIMNWETDEYLTYLLTASGLNSTPVVSAMGTTVGGYLLNSLGTLKYSSDGRKLVSVHSFENNFVQLMDFDNSTGQLSNSIIFYPSTLAPSQAVIGVYGAAFSPNNQLLYISAWKVAAASNELFQFNISSGNAALIEGSKQLLWSANDRAAGALQVAPDGKIYYSKYRDSLLGAIHLPDVAGPGCNYQNDYINFAPKTDALSFGLPNFIASDLDSIYTPYDFERITGSCNDFTVQFRMNRQTGMDSVKWYFGDGAVSTAINPSHTYASAGPHTVTLEVYKLECGLPVQTIVHQVSLGAAAVSDFLPGDTSFCQIPANFRISSRVVSNIYRWSTGEQTSSISINSPGTYWLQVESNGCFFNDTIKIDLKAPIQVNLGPDQPVCFNDPITVTAAASGAISYLWNDGSTQSNIQVNFPGTYHVTVKNADGCVASDTLTTTWGDCPSYIPSAFSPNGDGLNETFGVINGMNSAIFTFIIYNRYGQVVFKTNDSRARWDGNFKGKKQPMGAYPWLITYKNRDGFIQTDKGQVMLIR